MNPFPPQLFSVLLIAIIGANVLGWRYRLRRAAGRGIIRPEDADRFVRVAGGGMMAFAVAHALVLATVRTSPLCLSVNGFSGRDGMRVLAVQVIFVVAALAWALGFGAKN